MNIGDKVRLVHGREEGIVSRFLPGNQVEVEIEDGFRIPVLKHEVVVVSAMEAKQMAKPEEKKNAHFVPAPRASKVFATKGIYIAFVPINDRNITVHLINNTDWKLPFILTEDQNAMQAGLAGSTLEPRSTLKVKDLIMQEFESWPTFDFRCFYYREGNMEVLAPFHKRLKCRVQSFYKKKENAPILLKNAHLYQLDLDDNTAKEPIKLSPEKLRESMLTGAVAEDVVRETVGNTFDLHIEKLTEAHTTLAKSEMLSTQLAEFEKYFEKAIANGMDEVTLIHGIGNGVLRDELHRRLSKHPNVAYFKDAQKERFGYGATLVKIK